MNDNVPNGYKELRAKAKELKISGFHKMKSGQLKEAVTKKMSDTICSNPTQSMQSNSRLETTLESNQQMGNWNSQMVQI